MSAIYFSFFGSWSIFLVGSHRGTFIQVVDIGLTYQLNAWSTMHRSWRLLAHTFQLLYNISPLLAPWHPIELVWDKTLSSAVYLFIWSTELWKYYMFSYFLPPSIYLLYRKLSLRLLVNWLQKLRNNNPDP